MLQKLKILKASKRLKLNKRSLKLKNVSGQKITKTFSFLTKCRRPTIILMSQAEKAINLVKQVPMEGPQLPASLFRFSGSCFGSTFGSGKAPTGSTPVNGISCERIKALLPKRFCQSNALRPSIF